MDFCDTAGAVIGHMLPTGAVRFAGCGGRQVEVSILNAGNPAVSPRALRLDLQATEPPPLMDGDSQLLDVMAEIRDPAAQLLGMV